MDGAVSRKYTESLPALYNHTSSWPHAVSRRLDSTLRASRHTQVYKDGSVRVHHGGVEIGQGIHTKVVQAAAFALGQLKCAAWGGRHGGGGSCNGAAADSGEVPLELFTVSARAL